jgi:hypothetical protein
MTYQHENHAPKVHDKLWAEFALVAAAPGLHTRIKDHCVMTADL